MSNRLTIRTQQGAALIIEATNEELKEYAKGKDVYAWCVSNPIRFKEPLPLKRLGLTRAPMSWHYL